MTTVAASGLDMQFTCPQCGGHCFGTGTDGYFPEMSHEQWAAASVGVCAAPTIMLGMPPQPGGCGFQWRRADDHLYFKPRQPGTRPSATRWRSRVR